MGSLKGSYVWAQNDDAMLLGWSMTKSILNALIGIRVRQGKLSLDQKALFPEWCERAGDARCGISILQLLQMSSGLYFDETYGAFGGATHMLFSNTDIAKYAISQGYDKGMRISSLDAVSLRCCSWQTILLLFRDYQHFDRCASQYLRRPRRICELSQKRTVLYVISFRLSQLLICTCAGLSP
jgi:hypothetical protein